jgi:hypothetical protein
MIDTLVYSTLRPLGLLAFSVPALSQRISVRSSTPMSCAHSRLGAISGKSVKYNCFMGLCRIITLAV